MKNFFLLTLSTLFLYAGFLFAEPKFVRWTGKEDPNGDLHHVLGVIKAKTGIQLSSADLMVVENRPLARTHFVMLAQMAANVPIKGLSIRLWTWRHNGQLVQAEAKVDEPPKNWNLSQANLRGQVSSQQLMAMVLAAVQKHPDDKVMRHVGWHDEWNDGELTRVVRVKGRRGYHKITVSLARRRVLNQSYSEFPQFEFSSNTMLAVPVQVYPIYEQPEGSSKVLPRIKSTLKYLLPQVPKSGGNPYAALASQRYLESKLDPVLGLTEEGRKQGFWAPSYVRAQARAIYDSIPKQQNTFKSGQVALIGKYVTVNLHPDAPSQFKNLGFDPAPSAVFTPLWQPTPEDNTVWEMVPGSSFLGKPLASYQEAYQRPAQRLPDHDPAQYIRDGFDEIQVYWAVNQMFDSLRPMGFLDPDLSERPFHAFLYDPDIAFRNNAYYTDDTINFTTYTKDAPNYARDNTTIWHELGHGVMDRLMGDALSLADTGGLSEGMADFIAQLVLLDVTNNKPFEGKEEMRIVNKTGFNLTNEVHDDGEAYGGAMNDMLVAVVEKLGKRGLAKITDLTLEAMRLARNHPGLTANDWFERMLFADELGNTPLRQPNELRSYILGALTGRNFNLDGSPVATYTVKYSAPGAAAVELLSEGPGSRGQPIRHELKEDGSVTYKLSVALNSSKGYTFKYPVTLKVELEKGPLQGAIRWVGQENTPLQHTVKADGEVVEFDLTALGTCDEINRPDNSCVDFAYLQVWNDGDKQPVAKKRFYLRVYPKE